MHGCGKLYAMLFNLNWLIRGNTNGEAHHPFFCPNNDNYPYTVAMLYVFPFLQYAMLLISLCYEK